jgi:hypothetical protein
MSATQEPVAWAVVLNAIEAISMNGGATYRVTASKEEADRIAAHAMAVVPLYEHPPQPTLTDEEREVLEREVELAEYQQRHELVATLRGLLERTNHDAVPEARAAEPESSVPPGSVAAPANTPTLTNEEREAIEWFAEVRKPLTRLTQSHNREKYKDTLRGLLERLGGQT